VSGQILVAEVEPRGRRSRACRAHRCV